MASPQIKMVSNLVEDILSRSFNVIGLFSKKFAILSSIF